MRPVPESPATRRVVAFVPDLFFAAKVAATAEAAGVRLEILEPDAVLARCAAEGAAPANAPALVILDLGAGERALGLARALKSAARAGGPPLVGFFSHVDTATRDAALAAGVDTVLPRSAFVARLPALLRGA